LEYLKKGAFARCRQKIATVEQDRQFTFDGSERLANGEPRDNLERNAMMKRLLIVSAGAFGREVLDWALAVPINTRDWEVAGFLDDRKDVLIEKHCSYPILGSPETYGLTDADRVVCAIGDPRTKLRYCHLLKNRGAKFVSVIHPTAIIGSNTRIGEGCIFCPYTAIHNNVSVGNYVVFNDYSDAGHDAVIGDGCTLSGHVDVTGWVVLGEGVFLGSHATVLPHVCVGDYAVVGAGSAVLKKVRPNATVIGVPAVEI